MRVIVRPPGEAFRRALSEHPGRETIDPAAARRQHEAFVTALRAAGVTLVELPADDELPDACFVSDVLITLPRAVDPGGPAAVAVATRPGAPSRRPEVAAVLARARGLLGATCPVAEIAAPGTLEGGDVIVYGDRVAIGVSKRTDRRAAGRLADLVRGAGYRAFLCPVEGRLHLATWAASCGPTCSSAPPAASSRSTPAVPMRRRAARSSVSCSTTTTSWPPTCCRWAGRSFWRPATRARGCAAARRRRRRRARPR